MGKPSARAEPLGDWGRLSAWGKAPVRAGRPSARAEPWETGEAFRQGQRTLGTGEARAGAEPYIGLLFYKRGGLKSSRRLRKSKPICKKKMQICG